MKAPISLLTAVLLLAPTIGSAQTPFTYQGKLENSGAPFTGTAHIRLGLYTATNGGTPLRQEIVPNVSVTDGIFTATPTTFAAADFSGAARWLQIDVSSDGGTSYVVLLPRQQVTYSPYALHASKSDTSTSVTGPISGSQLTGSINPALVSGGTIGQAITFSPVSGAPFSVSTNTKVANLNGDLLDGLDSTAFLRTTGGTLAGDLNITNPGILNFGARNGALISLYGNGAYGIGIQSSTLYQRTSGDFSWFYGGVHNDLQNNPGTNGVETMRLNGIGELSLLGQSAGLSFKNRDDATKRWVAYSAGTGAADNFHIWSAATGDRLSVDQFGNTSVTGNLSAKGLYAISSGPSDNVIIGRNDSSTGTGAGLYGYTNSPNGSAVIGWSNSTGWAGYFNGKIYASGTSFFNGTATFNSATTFNGAATLNGEVTAQGANAGFVVRNRNDQTKRWVMYSRNVSGSDQLIFYNDIGGDVAALTNTGNLYLDGSLSTTVLTIRGGADVAEPFQMAGAEKLEEGSVVVIDPASPGKLKLSNEAYDRCVAGVISGAGGVQPGLRLQQDGVLEGGQHVALTGRVYVKADASEGAIKPGDLLTTSNRPGHAMKVSDHSSSQGAVLGKAMTPLDEGTGLVLVLVTLQ